MDTFRIATVDNCLAHEWIKKLESKGLKMENEVSPNEADVEDDKERWAMSGILVDPIKKSYFIYYGPLEQFKKFCRYSPLVSFTKANKLIKELQC